MSSETQTQTQQARTRTQPYLTTNQADNGS